MHSLRSIIPQFDCPWPFRNFFCHDMAASIYFRQKVRVIAIRIWAIAEPPNATTWHELVDPALNVVTIRVPRKPRSLMELSIGAIQQFDFVRIWVPRRPRLSVNKIGENLLAGCVNNYFVVNKQVCLFWIEATRPMNLFGALCSIRVDNQSLIRWL
jgi:hypothetical protein